MYDVTSNHMKQSDLHREFPVQNLIGYYFDLLLNNRLLIRNVRVNNFPIFILSV